MVQKQRGFTLVEMMVVIAIIGVLAAFAIPSYQNYLEKGRLAEAKQLLVTIKQEYENAKMQTPNNYDTLKKAKDNVVGIRTKKAQASPIGKLYSINTLVESVDNSNAHYLVASVVPKDASKSSVYMTANGNVYKCPKGALQADTIPLTKPNTCKDKI